MTSLHLWVLNNNSWQYLGQRPAQRTDNITPGVFESLQSLRDQGFNQYYLLVAFAI